MRAFLIVATSLRQPARPERTARDVGSAVCLRLRRAGPRRADGVRVDEGSGRRHEFRRRVLSRGRSVSKQRRRGIDVDWRRDSVTSSYRGAVRMARTATAERDRFSARGEPGAQATAARSTPAVV